jgi:uncharacterized phiE125 gp8 family phage protein
MQTRLITPVAYEPVSLGEIKLSLRIDDDDSDTVLATYYIPAARDWVERRVQTKFATQTWEMTLDEFPDGNIAIPFGPVMSITSIKYDDEDLVEQTLDASEYRLAGSEIVAIDAWPVATEGASVRVRFVAGNSYATDPLPESIKAAIVLKVVELFDGTDMSRQIDSLLTNHLKLEA